MTCAQGLLRLLWGGGPKLECYGTGTDRRSVIIIRVKVNSKPELVEDREEKSALYGVICCCDDRLLSRALICGHTV